MRLGQEASSGRITTSVSIGKGRDPRILRDLDLKGLRGARLGRGPFLLVAKTRHPTIWSQALAVCDLRPIGSRPIASGDPGPETRHFAGFVPVPDGNNPARTNGRGAVLVQLRPEDNSGTRN